MTTETVAKADAAAVADVTTTTTIPEQPKKSNRIQVSNTKKPLFFYVNLAKRYMQQHNEVVLSALGMAMTTVVTISEILKSNGFATEKNVLISTVGMKDEAKGKMVQKARIEIVLGKSEKFEELMSRNNSSQEANTNKKEKSPPEPNTNKKEDKSNL